MHHLKKHMACPLVLVLAAALQPAPVQAADIPGVLDLFVTSSAAGLDSFIDFSIEGPIPGDFFYIGSAPFAGLVTLEGRPLGQCGGPVLPPNVDTIMRRLTAASPLPQGGSDVVDVEIVALSLVSTTPITVMGSMGPQLWWVDVCLTPGAVQPVTQMTINHEFANGGTLVANVSIAARVRFKRDSDGVEKTLDDVYTFVGTAGTWAHTAGAPIDADVGPGVELDADCDGACDAPLPVGTSNFIAGYNSQANNKNPMQHVKPGEKHYIEPPQSPAKIPTLSEWGMVVVLLIMLSAGTIMFGFRKPAVAGVEGGAGIEQRRATFVPAIFGPVLAIALAATVALLAGAMFVFGPLKAVDIGGAFVSAIALAYLIHLWVVLKRS